MQAAWPKLSLSTPKANLVRQLEANLDLDA